MPASTSRDHPGVLIFPPLLWLIGAGLSSLLHFLFPSPFLRADIARFLGFALAASAIVLILWAARTLKAGGTNVHPNQPALAIVRAGPYRFTRNPMYLALVSLQLALGFFLNDWLTLAFALPVALILHFGVILREERYLEGKFGEPYRALKRDVRRWL